MNVGGVLENPWAYLSSGEQGQAWEGQWGLRFKRQAAQSLAFDQVGPHTVSGLTSGSTAEGGAILDVSGLLALVIDLSTTNGMDATGASTGVLVTASVSTVFGVYYCLVGDFVNSFGFIIGAPQFLDNGIYVAANSANGRKLLFLGWIRIDAARNLQDNVAQRLVINWYNRQNKPLILTPGYVNDNAATNLGALNTANWARINAGTGDTGEYIATGQDVVDFAAHFVLGAVAPAAAQVFGIGDNSNTAPVACTEMGSLAIARSSCTVRVTMLPPVGYRTVTMLGRTGALATTLLADDGRNGAAADIPATSLYGDVPT